MAKKLDQLIPDIKQIVTKAAQFTSFEIIQSLAQKGPAYSGKFSSAWYAVEPGKSAEMPRQTGKGYLYTYTISDIPLRLFTETYVYYTIVNSSKYAPVALDLEEGHFIKPAYEPIKKAGDFGVTAGTRTGNYRYQVENGDGTSISTAPKDWYTTYVRGGEMQQSITVAIYRAFASVKA